jgi:hypothetical protein
MGAPLCRRHAGEEYVTATRARLGVPTSPREVSLEWHVGCNESAHNPEPRRAAKEKR